MNKTLDWSKLSPRLGRNGGFGAAIAIIILSLGTLTLSMTALGAALAYSDSVYKKEMRFQFELNKRACDDTASLILEKDLFVSGFVDLPEFKCKVEF